MTKYGHSILRGLTVLTTAALLTLTSAEAAIQHRTSEAETAQEALQTDSINAAEDTLLVKPWPYNVREAVDSLLASPMFSTSMMSITSCGWEMEAVVRKFPTRMNLPGLFGIMSQRNSVMPA